MNQLIARFHDLTSLQKRAVLTAIVCLPLLVIFALSRQYDNPAPLVQEVKPSDFRNGALTSDPTASYYQSKDNLVRKQLDALAISQKAQSEKMEEIQRQIAQTKQEAPSSPPDSAPANSASQEVAQEPSKKMIRRGHNQSIIKFLSSSHIDRRLRVL